MASIAEFKIRSLKRTRTIERDTSMVKENTHQQSIDASPTRKEVCSNFKGKRRIDLVSTSLQMIEKSLSAKSQVRLGRNFSINRSLLINDTFTSVFPNYGIRPDLFQTVSRS